MPARSRFALLVSIPLVLVTLVSSCAKKSATPPIHVAAKKKPKVMASSPEFAKFVDDYFDASFRFDPVAGTEAGLHQYDTELGDRSREAIDARIGELHAFLHKLHDLDPTRFSFDDSIDAAMIESDIRSKLLDLETLQTWKRNPMGYAELPGEGIDSLIKRDLATNWQRLLAVTRRLDEIPALYESAEKNLDDPPRVFTELAIRMSVGTASYLAGPVAAWAKGAAGDDPALLQKFEASNAKAIAATKKFNAWLKSDLLPRSKGDYAIGEKNFLAKLRDDEMVDMPLDELLARGEANLEKDSAAFVATAKKIDASKSPREVMAILERDHPTARNLIPSVKRSLEAAREFVVNHHLVTIPSDVRPIVEETPPYARSGAFASMDTPGPYEAKATEAFYYVTPVEKNWNARHKEEHLRLFNPYVVAMIDIHEAYPGHYVQFLYAPRFPTKTRKLLYCNTNVEGWAHYTEQMMVDQGFGGGDPKIRFAQLEEALLRDVRYVVGIKLHTAGWTVKQGAKLFEEKAFQEPANALEEARRGTYDPTYLYYTLGKLEIQDLRDEYMRKTGATLEQFHDAFLAQGGLPIPLMRKVLLR